MSTTGNRQLNLPPTEVRTSEGGQTDFRKSEGDRIAFGKAEDDAALAALYAESANLFDAACEAAKLTNKEVAHLWKCSESLVQKMRAPGARISPSFAQLLRLPPTFHIELHKTLNQRYGFGRQALLDLLDAAGRLALAVDR